MSYVNVTIQASVKREWLLESWSQDEVDLLNVGDPESKMIYKDEAVKAVLDGNWVSFDAEVD